MDMLMNWRAWLIGLLAAWFLPSLLGCSTLDRKAAEVEAYRVETYLKALHDAGIRGNVTISLKAKPFRAGMFNGFILEPPFDIEIISTANMTSQRRALITTRRSGTGVPPGAPD